MSIRLSGAVAYVYKVILESLKKLNVDVVSGAIDEDAVVIAIKYESLIQDLVKDINTNIWKTKFKEGKLYFISTKEVVDSDINEINMKILSKLKKYNVDAQAMLTSDNEAILVVNLEQVIYFILQNAVDECKKRASGHMRALRVKFASDDQYGYIVLYKKKSSSSIESVKNILEKL